MGIFDAIEQAPPDAIFGLNQAFREDPRPHKVDLGVGIYRTAEGKTPLLSCVHKAELQLAQAALLKVYLPIDGDPALIQQTAQLVFGKESPLLAQKRLYGAHVAGGTAALRIAGDFFSQVLRGQTLYLPHPTWPNHRQIFLASRLNVERYDYFDSKKKEVAFDLLTQQLLKMESGSALLLHASCHNPTGADPTLDQWRELARIVRKQRLFPIFDCAYQGFGDGLDEDVASIRLFAQEGLEFCVCYSYSKNFGLYAERVGALFFVTESAKAVERIGSQIRPLIRTSYSNPPLHGARLVTTILGDLKLRADWEIELSAMRGRIQEMRKTLIANLSQKSELDVRALSSQKGLFSFCGLERDQVDRLIADHAIYMPSSGRINVTGLNSNNLKGVVEAIAAVL